MDTRLKEADLCLIACIGKHAIEGLIEGLLEAAPCRCWCMKWCQPTPPCPSSIEISNEVSNVLHRIVAQGSRQERHCAACPELLGAGLLRIYGSNTSHFHLLHTPHGIALEAWS